MVFSSTVFLFAFLPFALIGYNLIRKELKNLFLLVISIAFYAYGEPNFVFVMTMSIAVNYLCGLLIDSFKNNLLVKRGFLCLNLLCSLGILFYYKYFDFFITNINRVSGSNLDLKHIALPIGISFFTFQGMSYIFDLYMGKTKVQKNPLNVALYVALFPQLIAGPIVRYVDINEQIDERSITVDGFAEGVKRFIYGLTKKIFISNQVALIADKAFSVSSGGNLSVAMAWLGAICYTLQIYFDFSGYSDMAIGLGKMFGFNFLENFNYPYISRSITEFWRRWHISLSTWFRDYVYIPLGGNRKGNVYVNLTIVFILTGVWHGASWTFILWGMWHGLFMLIERISKKNGISLKIERISFIKWIYTMIIVVLGWVLFRAENIAIAKNYVLAMFGIGVPAIVDTMFNFYFSQVWSVLVIGVIFSTPLSIKISEQMEKTFFTKKIKTILEPAIICGLFIISISYTVTSNYNPFIYFNF